MRALAPLNAEGTPVTFAEHTAIMNAPLEELIVYWGIVQVNSVYAKQARKR